MKNKKGQELFSVAALIIILILAVSLFVGLLGYLNYRAEIIDCQNYESYGYYTEIVGDLWDKFGGKSVCLIVMEDGTRLPLRDYKTMAIKNALVR